MKKKLERKRIGDYELAGYFITYYRNFFISVAFMTLFYAMVCQSKD